MVFVCSSPLLAHLHFVNIHNRVNIHEMSCCCWWCTLDPFRILRLSFVWAESWFSAAQSQGHVVNGVSWNCAWKLGNDVGITAKCHNNDRICDEIPCVWCCFSNLFQFCWVHPLHLPLTHPLSSCSASDEKRPGSRSYRPSDRTAAFLPPTYVQRTTLIFGQLGKLAHFVCVS